VRGNLGRLALVFATRCISSVWLILITNNARVDIYELLLMNGSVDAKKIITALLDDCLVKKFNSFGAFGKALVLLEGVRVLVGL
jgi:hypothetical protein